MPLPKRNLIPGILILLAMVSLAAPPLWWSQGNPPVVTGVAENNKGPANIGQAKNMVAAALQALDTQAPTIATQVRADLLISHPDLLTVPSPKTPEWIEKQKAPLLLGQLKAVSAPFYTRVNALNPTWLAAERTTNGTNHPNSIFPWTAATTDDANKAIANIGQLKAVFSLRFDALLPPFVDDDGDSMDDSWELANGLDPLDTWDAYYDLDGDGISNLYEYLLGLDPWDIATNGTSDISKDRDGDGMPDAWEVTAGNLNDWWGYSWIEEQWIWDQTLQRYIFVRLLDWENPADANHDLDDDGLTNLAEYQNSTFPLLQDSDYDYLPDGWEIQYGLVAAPSIQLNGTWIYGNDGENGSTGDPDGDGIQNQYEYLLGFHPKNANTNGTPDSGKDRDGDGLPDFWEAQTGSFQWSSSEQRYGFVRKLDWENPTDATQDPDTDSLTNLAEFTAGTDPNDYDTDGDLLPDGWEVTHGLNPLDATGINGAAADADGDGLSNLQEYLNGTNPGLSDTDGDGTSDGNEVDQGGNPNDPSDGGQPPPVEEMVNIPFSANGDYALWEMTITGKGPKDMRVQKIVTTQFNQTETKSLKLRKGNTYEVRMRHLATKPNVNPATWWCWEAKVDGLPNVATFNSYNSTRIPNVATAFMVGGHWLADNRDGLLSAHVHMRQGGGSNIAGSKMVTLLPVDLDIVHPATGELAEDREDGTSASPDGGYVSIKRTVGSDAIAMGGEDVAPVTKLSIKAIQGASTTTKVRLKFNAGDRYKIYKDELRTEEVTSEQTEFDATQTTTLYFQGLKKSLSRGGEEVRMQVKIADAWVDGDSVKCTIVQSEFLVQIKAFIPYEWTEGESVWLINGLNPMNGKVAHGDNRGTAVQFENKFSNKDTLYSAAPFRLCHEVILTPYVDLHYFYQDLEAERKFTSALTSDHYNKASSVNASELALRNGYLPLTPPSIATGPPVLSPATYSPDLSLYNSLRVNKCALDLTASGKDGAMGIFTTASPAIDWDVRLEIDASSNPLQPSFRVKGEHDLYPAYEIITLQADGTFKDTHRHMPNRDVYPGPISLGSASITFDNSGNLSN